MSDWLAGMASRCRASHSCGSSTGGGRFRLGQSGVFGAVGERHGRVNSHQLDTRLPKGAKHRGVAGSDALEGAEEAVHVQRLAVGPERGDPGAKTQRPHQIQHIQHQPCLVPAREGVLHQHDAARPLFRRQGGENFRRGSR